MMCDLLTSAMGPLCRLQYRKTVRNHLEFNSRESSFITDAAALWSPFALGYDYNGLSQISAGSKYREAVINKQYFESFGLKQYFGQISHIVLQDP